MNPYTDAVSPDDMPRREPECDRADAFRDSLGLRRHHVHKPLSREQLDAAIHGEIPQRSQEAA